MKNKETENTDEATLKETTEKTEATVEKTESTENNNTTTEKTEVMDKTEATDEKAETTDGKTEATAEKTEEQLEEKFLAIEKKYKLAVLKYDVFKNQLIGLFKENEYEIPELISKELLRIVKLIEVKTLTQYEATAIINKKTFNFVVPIEKLENGDLEAKLFLCESLEIGLNQKTKIKTCLGRYVEQETPNFLYNVKKAFNLKTKEELLIGKNEYISPPIETFSEVKFKSEILEKYNYKREELEKKYILAVLKELKSTPHGKEIIRKFIKEVKAKNPDAKAQKNYTYLRQILDNIIDQEISQKLISKAQKESVYKAREKYVELSKEAKKEFETNKEKENATALATPTPAPAVATSAPSGPKGKGGEKKKDSKKDNKKKDNKKKDGKKKEEKKKDDKKKGSAPDGKGVANNGADMVPKTAQKTSQKTPLKSAFSQRQQEEISFDSEFDEIQKMLNEEKSIDTIIEAEKTTEFAETINNEADLFEEKTQLNPEIKPEIKATEQSQPQKIDDFFGELEKLLKEDTIKEPERTL